MFLGSKTATLKFIEEKTTRRINSWQHKFLSQGGKEVLLKAVAYAIPAYTMSCYLLPKEMITRLNQSFARFWWKNTKTGRGIHWLAWEKLTKSKEEGGLGFRQLEGSNQALLGKQLWRLANSPQSLLARAMKARYYPQTSILQATIGHRPSCGWRSILSSQHLMTLGMKKEIGTGEHFDFWGEPWIEDDTPRPLLALYPEAVHDWALSDFKEALSDQWNIANLCSAIVTDDIHRILQVIPGGEGSQQSYSWIHTNTGDYSVKSGYKLWSTKIQNASLVPEQQPSFSVIFTEIWRVNTSSKLQHFLWKCSVSALSVGVEMRKKRLTSEATCQICGAEQEDIQHLIFKCPMARALWLRSPFAAITYDSSYSFNGQLYACMKLSEAVREEDRTLWPWIMWRIWKMRNALIFQNQVPDIEFGINAATADHYEWTRHTKSIPITPAPTTMVLESDTRWIPPRLGVLKCNTDASWHKDKERCGIGWILRDDKGQLKFWGVKTYLKLRSPLEAEVAALTWAARCIDNMGYDNVIFETDSSSTAEAVKEPDRWPRLLTYTSQLQYKINQKRKSFQVQKISRERNKAADTLAKYAQDKEIYFGTIEITILLWVQPFLDANF